MAKDSTITSSSEPECRDCALQDEAAKPGTRFHVGEDLRSVYLITNSGKRVPIVSGVDFVSAEFVRDALQDAWYQKCCDEANPCGFHKLHPCEKR